MINSIARHAAQTIWHNTLQDATASCGILLSQQACIVAGVAYSAEQPLINIIEQHTAESSKQWCGWFYTLLPSIETIIAQQQRWEEFNDGCGFKCVHLHLDADTAGLLKIAAYHLNNGNLSTINLTMATD